jgi:hypothetical protein
MPAYALRDFVQANCYAKCAPTSSLLPISYNQTITPKLHFVSLQLTAPIAQTCRVNRSYRVTRLFSPFHVSVLSSSSLLNGCHDAVYFATKRSVLLFLDNQRLSKLAQWRSSVCIPLESIVRYYWLKSPPAESCPGLTCS